MRILIATDYYPPFIGGAQIQSRLLARGLRDRGHEVLVATVAQPGRTADEWDDGIPVRRLRHLRTAFHSRRQGVQSHHPPFADPVTVLGLRRVVRAFGPDVVHSYGWISYSCAAALARTGVPLLLAARDYGYACANRTLLRDQRACDGPALLKCLGCAGRNYGRPKGWLAAAGVLGSRGFLRRRVGALQAISAYVLETARRDFLHDADVPVHVIHDLVRTDDADHTGDPGVRPWLERLPAEPFVLFVGALRQAKGVDELLAAYRLLDEPPPLVLLGTIEPDTPASFPPGVHVLTDVPHAAVLAAWDRSLFGVMPSRLPEPLGTAVMEAMARGRAVIGTEPGGHADMIVPGETGLLVPRGDVGALAGAMRTLIADPALRERLGAAAAARSARLGPAATLPALERALAELARRR